MELPQHMEAIKTPGSIPKTLFNVSAVIGFPKNGVDVTEIDIKIT